MAFKKSVPPAFVPDSPLRLFQDHLQGKVDNLWSHQIGILRAYADQAANHPDVALQLPTGSGKTLVGLLIAEWQRRKHGDRVVYLCPTRQLVNQVAEQAQQKYGLNAIPFTGSAADYSPAAKSAYSEADAVAVTTYSSLFNTNPYFHDASVVVLDDAHAAENYLASLWSVRIDRQRHQALHLAICGLLSPVLGPANLSRLTGEWSTATDQDWVDKISTPDLIELADSFTEILDIHSPRTDLTYGWSKIRGNLLACHVYLSTRDILIRPLIPPTWTHTPFTAPRQRVYMSATLGLGGDLERITGRPKIHRLPLPEGGDGQGIGRRFFMFPEMSLDETTALDLRYALMDKAGRSLLLVPSSQTEQETAKDIQTQLGFPTFDADAIEYSKDAFVSSPKAVAVVAGRYDGIDFPGDECRLLFIDGLPKATNSQERFLMGKMGATILYNERIQTRVIQAIGRCTRSAKDYSAVIVTGEDLTRYLTDSKRMKYLVPELQGELSFGINQSKYTCLDDMIDNFRIFLENKEEWAQANDQIVALRDASTQLKLPAIDELEAAVSHEIQYQARLWQQDYSAALGEAESVLGELTNSDLRGYRALWHYLAGSAAWMADLYPKARNHFGKAKENAYGIPWLVTLTRQRADQSAPDGGPKENTTLLEQIERVEAVLSKMGTTHDRGFAKREKAILEGIESNDTFEQAQVLLGELLGFDVGKIEVDGSPDPWWIAGNQCLVFEDHAGALEGSAIDVKKARQAASHPNWMRQNVDACRPAQMSITTVLLTPVSRVRENAVPHLEGVALWGLAEFRTWAKTAVVVVRNLRSSYQEPGDLLWRIKAAEAFESNALDLPSLVKGLREKPAASNLQPIR